MELEDEHINHQSVYKAHWFYCLTMIWSIGVSLFSLSNEYTFEYVALLIPISIYFMKNKKEIKKALKLRCLNIQTILCIPILCMMVLPVRLFMVSIYQALLGTKMIEVISKEVDHMSPTPMMALIFIAITPAILEEVMMRGIVLHGYRYKSIHIAAIANGILFGMIHLNTFQFFHTVILGVIATYLVYITKSIFASMWLHFINNGTPILLSLWLDSHVSQDMPTKELPDQSMPIIVLGVLSLLTLPIAYRIIAYLCKIHKVSIGPSENKSNEKVINVPIVISGVIFIGINMIFFIK